MHPFMCDIIVNAKDIIEEGGNPPSGIYQLSCDEFDECYEDK